MNAVKTALLLSLLVISACSMRSDFEDLAYQGCIKEAKYPDKICACNAKNLDRVLSEQEKSTYEKAALADPAAALELVRFMGKLFEALRACT